MKRLWIALMGGTALLAGCVMLVTPGPGLPVILVALAVLATEFLWARRWLARCRGWCRHAPLPRRMRVWLRWLTKLRSRPVVAVDRQPVMASVPRWMSLKGE